MSDIQGQIVLAENSAGNGLQRLKLNSAGLLRVAAEATSVSANQINLNTDGLEALQTAMATDLAAIEVINTNAEVHLGNIDTGIDVLEACVGSNKVNVNISSGNITGFSTASNQATIIGHIDGVESSLTAITGYVDGIEGKQDTMISHMDGVEGLLGTIDAVLDASLVKQTAMTTDLAALEVLQTATNSKIDKFDAVLDASLVKQTAMTTDLAAIEVINTNAEVHLGNIDTGVDVLEACVGSNKVNVNISSGNISGFSTASNQSTIIGHIDGVETLIGTTNSTLSTMDGVLDASLVKQTAMTTDIAALEVLHTATNQKLDDIETAVQLIDDAIKTEDLAHSSGDKGIPCLMVRQDSHSDLAADGDYMIPTINANGEIRVTSGSSGGSTEAKQDDMETTLDAILAKNSEIETTNNANQVLLGTIDSDTDAIKTSAAALVVDLAAIEVLHTATNSKIDTFDAVLDASLVKQTAMTTDLAAIEILLTAANVDHAANEALLINAEAHLGEIEGAVETIETAIKAEDAAHSSGDTGIMALCVRQDSQADFGANGDYVPMSINADGELRTTGAIVSTVMTVDTLMDGVGIAANATTNSSVFTKPKNVSNFAVLVSSASGSGGFSLRKSKSVDGTTFIEDNTNINAASSRQLHISESNEGFKFYRYAITNVELGSVNHTIKICY